MHTTILVLFGLNYTLIILLPFIYFVKRERGLSAMWCVTAAPFVLLPCFMFLPNFGVMQALVAAESMPGIALAALSALSSAISLGLVAWARSAHRERPPQWHQQQDLPTSLTTHGPYVRMRHPFYSAYLLMFLAAVLIVPNAGTLGVLIYAVIALNHTAAREERRLCASRFGEQYHAYVAQSGRFVPAISRKSA